MHQAHKKQNGALDQSIQQAAPALTMLTLCPPNSIESGARNSLQHPFSSAPVVLGPVVFVQDGASRPTTARSAMPWLWMKEAP